MPILYFLGDSHVRTAEHAYRIGAFGDHPCSFESVGGATAVGLRHPTSKTQALVHFRNILLPYRPDIVPIFQLGEVDCGFVIWIRAQRHNESISEQLEAAIRAYIGFLLEMKQVGYRNLVVTSAILPTLEDGILLGDVAKERNRSFIRSEVEATFRQRTDLTLQYNASLAKECALHDFCYVDFTPDLLDPSTKLLHHDYRHPNPCDHHLHPDRAGHLWADKILMALGYETEHGRA